MKLIVFVTLSSFFRVMIFICLEKSRNHHSKYEIFIFKKWPSLSISLELVWYLFPIKLCSSCLALFFSCFVLLDLFPPPSFPSSFHFFIPSFLLPFIFILSFVPNFVLETGATLFSVNKHKAKQLLGTGGLKSF